jgi:hypothetical protein
MGTKLQDAFDYSKNSESNSDAGELPRRKHTTIISDSLNSLFTSHLTTALLTKPV